MSGVNQAINRIPLQMRALVLSGTGFENLAVQTVPVPRPGPGQLLARVDAAGICTSLIKLVEQGSDHQLLSGWDVSRYPLILGDEGCVTICEVGTDLEARYRVGERYVTQPAVDHAPINHRERYREGGRGVAKVAAGYTLPGHLAEYMLIPEEIIAAGCLLSLPDVFIPFAHAATAEPLSCAISAQDHHLHLSQDSPLAERKALRGLKPGGVTVVIGAGVMGRMQVDLALSYRPRAIVVADLIAERLQRVRDLFCRRAAGMEIQLVTVQPGEVKQQVERLSDYQGADDVIVAVGSRAAIAAAQELLGRGSVLNLFGGLKKGEDMVPMSTSMIHYREVNVTGSSGGSPWDIARALDLMARGELDPSAHITRIGDLEHAPHFLEMIKRQELDGKAVVYPHRRTEAVLAVEQWRAQDEARYLTGAGDER
jgi:L-sorbose 1-phosphate reductase